MSLTPIQSFFEARSYAIVGATGNRDKLGWFIVESFLNDFDGDIYLVNTKGGEIEGHHVYTSIAEIEGDVDAAVIAIPAQYVNDVVRQCVDKGIPAVIVESGGFAEVGQVKRQEELYGLIEGTGTRIIGPNCIGVLSPSKGIDTIFIPQSRVARPGHGPISFFTQSGALGSAILSAFRHTGDGKWFSRFASYGNAVDVNESDLLEYFGGDAETEIILAHLEGFRDGERFLQLAKEITPEKPVVVLKTNRTSLGAKASESHSASVAANDLVVSDLLRMVGVIRVEEFEEMIRVAKALRSQPIPPGPRVGIVTDGGGFAVSASDAIEHEGLEMAKLEKSTIDALLAKYPPWYVSNNPLDLTGTVTAEEFMFGMEKFLFDPNVDVVLMIIIPSAPQFSVEQFTEMFTDFMVNVKPNYPEAAKKPVFVVTLGGEESAIVNAKMDKLDVPTFLTPDHALRIVRYLAEYRKFLNRRRR
ncbi:MAG: acetate--CoA ligase family protein [Candidatus Kariarchaeaceae archaeon]|jgi:acyl-CoA synthetase (NDP forming)